MYQSQEKRAWERGVRLAAIWKGTKKIFTRLDQRCVMLAKLYKLPKWLGHMPLLLAVLCSLVALIAGGLLISCSAVLLWDFFWIGRICGGICGRVFLRTLPLFICERCRALFVYIPALS